MLMSLQELVGGQQNYRISSKSPLLFHPTLPFIHLHPVYPQTPASCHIQSVQGASTESKGWGTTLDPPSDLTCELKNRHYQLTAVPPPPFVLCFSVFTALSGSSSNAKYDPDQIKVEIACRRERVSHYRRRTMGCSEGPFWVEKGAGVWPLQDTVALARGLERMRMRSSSKGQAEARSLTHTAKSDISLRSVT